MSAARSVNDLDQLPSQHHLAQNTLPAYRAAPDYETAIRNKLSHQVWSQQQQPKFITDMVQAGHGLSLHEDPFQNMQPSLAQQGHPASSMYSTSTPELNR